MEKGETPPPLKVYIFEEDTKLCLVATLEEYIKRANIWHGKNKSQVLLSFVKPPNPAFSSTISGEADIGRVRQYLGEAGIDTEIFKGHSTRSASKLKARLEGLSVADILERGCWGNASTWKRFYNRKVRSSAEKYQNEVLSKKL